MQDDHVTERLGFARRRSEDLLGLIARDEFRVEAGYRQQLVQEFFFHLVGAMDLVAQVVNERRNLKIDAEEVTITKVARMIPTDDPLRQALRSLYANPRRKKLSVDAFSEEGYLFRIYNYRHQVTHRRRNPFILRMGNPEESSQSLFS